MLYVPPHNLGLAERILFSLGASATEKRRIERYLLYYHLGQIWLSHH